MKKFVIAGIGTGVGKTLVSAIVTEALEADYWKPVQAGDLEQSDTLTVKGLVTNSKTYFHPEAYRLNSSMSPHAAAEIDEVIIRTEALTLPETNNHLIVELAGGVMVPLTNSLLNIDLLSAWKVPVLLVSQNYLGSINHTLLTIEALRSRDIPIFGMVFNGLENKSTETLILNYTQIPCLLRIPKLDAVTPRVVKQLADTLRSKLT